MNTTKPIIGLVVLLLLSGVGFYYFSKMKKVAGIAAQPFRLVVREIFYINGRGVVLLGKIESGIVEVGDNVTLESKERARHIQVLSIEKFKKFDLKSASAGQDDVGIGISDLKQSDVNRGDVLVRAPKQVS